MRREGWLLWCRNGPGYKSKFVSSMARVYLKHLKDGGAIVGDRHVADRVHKHLGEEGNTDRVKKRA